MNERHLFTNRLIHQKSPYLLQHAHNPVDWYPWGSDAFSAAKEQDKPIFLSIGYATCHWCHVMEKESFEDPDVARLMNETFINIKVDREELPEVDSLYMDFAQSMMAGSAGWPLNVLLTPDLQPFFAATYLPPEPSHGLTGLVDVIVRVKELWKGEERERVEEQAEHIVEVFSEHVHTAGQDLPSKEDAVRAAEMLFKMSDPQYGGLRGIPKFPIGYQWNFLLYYAWLTSDGRSLFLAERTLDMMHRGGIYDHLGGGFSRYSVDEKWLVPHFEKMLYDNALLAFCYLQAWQATQKPLYRQVCESILNYILRDMTHPDGGFYSAEDADSEGHEGYFYTWTKEEIQKILGEEESAIFCEFYQVTDEGNFEGRNILNTPMSLEEFAVHKGMDADEIEDVLALQREVLWKVREKRVRPFKDDKILSSWNGLMIHALAWAGAVFDEPRYSQAAVRAAEFIRNRLWFDGALYRRWRDGEALYKGGLDEHAFLIKGLIALFETGHGTLWLDWALELTGLLKLNFKSSEGAFYQAETEPLHLILQKCQFPDGAEPSGNAIHCENLLKLYHLTLDKDYLEQAEDILKAVNRYIENYSPGYSYHIMNVLRYYDAKATTAVIAFNKSKTFEQEIKRLFFSTFLPDNSLVWKYVGDEKLGHLIPFADNYQPANGETTLYLCHEGACSRPLTSLSDMIAQVQEL